MPVLLPEMRIGQSQSDPGIGRAAWNGQADRTGQIGQSTQSVVTNLVALEVIQAAGVSLPLAPAKAFEWRLAAGDETVTHQQAVDELRMLFLAQFLGLVDQVSYSLGQPRLLAKVLRAEAKSDDLVLWIPKVNAQAVPPVLAGSLAPMYPLFPAASVQLATGRSAVARWLIENSRGDVAVVTDRLQLVDRAKADQFRSRIGALLQNSSVVSPTGPWYQPLQKIAAV